MIGQRDVILNIVKKGQARGHQTPVFEALSGRGITEDILKAPEKEAGYVQVLLYFF